MYFSYSTSNIKFKNERPTVQEINICKLTILKVLHLLGPSYYIMMCQTLFSRWKYLQFYKLCIENWGVKETFSHSANMIILYKRLWQANISSKVIHWLYIFSYNFPFPVLWLFETNNCYFLFSKINIWLIKKQENPMHMVYYGIVQASFQTCNLLSLKWWDGIL